MEILLALSLLGLPLAILFQHNHSMRFRQLELSVLKSEQRATDELIYKMQTGQYAREYTGPRGPVGPQGCKRLGKN
jgi:hypothetical protein